MKRLVLGWMKRALSFLCSLLLLTVLVFAVSRLAPGDPLVSYYGERAEKLLPEERAAAQARLGLDAPLPVQYARWLAAALRGDFGVSYKYKMPVGEVIAGQHPAFRRAGLCADLPAGGALGAAVRLL